MKMITKSNHSADLSEELSLEQDWFSFSISSLDLSDKESSDKETSDRGGEF
jgi:hypothetical protein